MARTALVENILVALEGNIRIRLAEGEYEGKAALLPSGLSHTVHYVEEHISEELSVGNFACIWCKLAEK